MKKDLVIVGLAILVYVLYDEVCNLLNTGQPHYSWEPINN